MKKSRNIPAAICFALALIFLVLACVGVNLDKEAVQETQNRPRRRYAGALRQL